MAGAPATKASRLVAPDEAVSVRGPRPRFVGRGGEKLAAALEGFGLDLTGLRVLDAGSSTGGFTDCALQAGARAVVAVDVGRGQLHQKLRADERVDVRERTNIRHLTAADIGTPVDALVGDLSFISLRLVAPALLGLVAPGASLVLLVKPQFEAGKEEVSRGRGVISDPAVWARTLREVGSALEALGAAIMGLMPSPLRGADGNVEFLIHVHAPGGTATPAPLADLVERALADLDHPASA